VKCTLPGSNASRRLSIFEAKRRYGSTELIVSSKINKGDVKMNAQSIKGNWIEVAGKLKQKYANLTNDDLLFIEGKEEELFGRLQKKLGKTKEEIRNLIEKI